MSKVGCINFYIILCLWNLIDMFCTFLPHSYEIALYYSLCFKIHKVKSFNRTYRFNFKNLLGTHVLYIFYSSFRLIWINVTLFLTVSESPNNTSAQTRTGWFRSRLDQQQQKYTCRFAHYSIIANFEYLFPLSSMCKFQVLETSSSCGFKTFLSPIKLAFLHANVLSCGVAQMYCIFINWLS